jgi:predicted DNA-binding transcriptional regulator AlpA
MAKKRAPTAATPREPVVLSVTQMAARCHLSRSRFSALVATGVFPKPRREPGRRPYYPTDLIDQCLEVRRAGVGANGQVVMFNRRLAKKSSR